MDFEAEPYFGHKVARKAADCKVDRKTDHRVAEALADRRLKVASVVNNFAVLGLQEG